jgi:hypothetical protein
LRIHQDDLSVAASDKQAMVRFIQGYGDVDRTLCDWLTGDQCALLAVNHIDLALGLVVQIDSRARLFEGHRFKGVPNVRLGHSGMPV